MTSDVQHRDWPERAWLLTAAGALVGLCVHLLVDGGRDNQPTGDAFRLATASFFVIAGMAFAYTVERARIASSLGFAAVSALIVAATVYWNGGNFGGDVGEPWRMLCALLTVAIAAPLFSAWRDDGFSRAIDYRRAHNRAWTNVVLWFASFSFVLIVWMLAWLLAELFGLIGLRWLRELLVEQWFAFTLLGGATGAAIGLLRDREAILGTLQRVVTTVLAVLAPVLAVGLVVFLISLPFTGLGALWEATRNTTPVLLACVIGALILINSVIGDRGEDESRQPVLRGSAMALGAAILPLGIIAAVSTGLRIGQYGLTPDRLWAVVFTGIACAYGLAYLIAVLRGRMAWSALLRPANLRLGLGLCALAFVLSTPLLSFGALSTRDQLARLEDGRTSPEKFDWRALRWDFGPSGKAAVERLARTGKTPAIRAIATKALGSASRYELATPAPDEKPIDQKLRVYPAGTVLPEALKAKLADTTLCGMRDICAVYVAPGDREVFAITDAFPRRLVAKDGAWVEPDSGPSVSYDRDKARREAIEKGTAKVEIRPAPRRQIFIDDQPAGQPFE